MNIFDRLDFSYIAVFPVPTMLSQFSKADLKFTSSVHLIETDCGNVCLQDSKLTRIECISDLKAATLMKLVMGVFDMEGTKTF